MIDLYQLKYFLTAARELNFSRAAESLGVSPPAISQSIALLERSVGRKLFHRDGRRVTLTAEGEALKRRAERVFDEMDAAEREISGAVARPTELRLAVREMITDYLLPPVLAEVERAHPGTRFALHELDAAAMTDALLKDRIDIGYFYGPLAHDELECRRLGAVTSRVYAAPSLLRRLGRPKTACETLRLPFVAPRSFNADPGAPSADGFPDDRQRRDIRYRAELMETHRRLAVSGLCATVLPAGVADEDRRAGRLIELPGPSLGREIYRIQRKGRRLPPAAAVIDDGLRRELTRWR